MSRSRTTRLLLSSAALVIILAGIKAVDDLVGPVVLALSLMIVFHPLRVVLERRMPSRAHQPATGARAHRPISGDPAPQPVVTSP